MLEGLRKAVFGWLSIQEVDICLLQETYRTKEVENVWKNSGRARCFSRMGRNTRGILILIRKSLEFELVSVRPDKKGRFIFLETFVQDQKFLFVKIYAANSDQTLFFLSN